MLAAWAGWMLPQTSNSRQAALLELRQVVQMETPHSNSSDTPCGNAQPDHTQGIGLEFKEELDNKVVEDFNKLVQDGSIDEYLEKFEELKSLMLQRTPILPEDYFVASFIGGLKSHLKPFVKALKPTCLDEAVQFARLQEDAVQATRNVSRTNPKPFQSTALLPTPKGDMSYNGNNSFSGYKSQTSNSFAPASSNNGSVNSNARSFRPTKILSAAERAEKSAKGLCYFCDQPYERGHKCATRKTQLFLVEIPGDEVDDDIGEGEALDENINFEILETEPCISFHAVNGIAGYQTMRVTGHFGKKAIQILVDSGSTHNFLDIELAKKLGCKLEPISLQPVTVADGSTLKCQYTYGGVLFKKISSLDFTINSRDPILGMNSTPDGKKTKRLLKYILECSALTFQCKVGAIKSCSTKHF
ncbi:unnamed protein product [Cuscuta campestris]|uniref:Ty3 transposon capsid-like protein domain-containing protein n=1 Tax=Cuscuta campestris TaxID=132261 RepID=A0A484LZH1_9ASTE|nr:unnamed protein product [Cuscuta campestris]